ncbi:MAG: GDP-mannose 4,6-dehydratase [Opitutales bacterium]
MRKLAVIGSNAFSAAYFIKVALEEGWDVVGISRSSEVAEPYRPYAWDSPSHKGTFRFVQAHLADDTDKILNVIEEEEIAYVVNFASLGMVAESWQYPKDYYVTNVVGNVALHEGLRRFDFLKKYVHVSTPEVYGNTSGDVKEDCVFNPSTPYAASRAACDLHLQTFAAQYDFPVVFTRAANVFGPGQQPYRIIPRAILCDRLPETLHLHGGGVSVRSFIHIRDVSVGTLMLLDKGVNGEAYHLSTDRYVSIRELVELIYARMGSDFASRVEVSPERPGKDPAYYLDSQKLHDLGWQPQVSLEDGIDETIRWIDQYLAPIRDLPLGYTHIR